jgi:hypothetical protein
MNTVSKENDIIVKFKKSRDIPVLSILGKVKSIRLSSIEVIDLDIESRTFFVKETFSGEKMKMINNSDSHQFDARRFKNFMESIKDFKKDEDGWLRE